MRLFRSKLQIEAAMRLALTACRSKKPHAALAEVASGGHVTEEDLAAMVYELPIFDLAVWHLLFLQVGQSLGAEELTKRFAIALSLACQDVGQDCDHVIGVTFGDALSYMDAVDGPVGQRMPDATIDTLYCHTFALRVIPDFRAQTEAERGRYYQVLDVARQAVRAAEAALAQLNAAHRIIVA